MYIYKFGKFFVSTIVYTVRLVNVLGSLVHIIVVCRTLLLSKMVGFLFQRVCVSGGEGGERKSDDFFPKMEKRERERKCVSGI